MKPSLLPSLAVLMAGAMGAPASAQDGAMWLDDRGRMMSMQFGGPVAGAPAPLDRTPAAMAAQFKRLCLDTNGDPAAIAVAAERAEAKLASKPFELAAGKKAPPIKLDIWSGDGLVVARTAGFFAAPVAQCNAIFYVNSLPDAESVTAAVSALVGSPPTNAADATKKNGKPNKSYEPEWAVTGGQIIVAHVAKGNQYMPGNRVHLAIRAQKKAG
jgi:hypothetical protein